jgi:pimeloyl-ACP methyl ester carboxylesterase
MNQTEIKRHEFRGCNFAYRVRGAGEPVVFIQGVGVHGDGWQPQVEELSADYACLTYDNRGLGQSQPPGVELSVDQMAQDTLALMDAQGWDAAHVVGHSLGGLIALNLALNNRRRVRSLSLLCTFASGQGATRLTPWLLWTGTRTRLGTRQMRRRAFLEIVYPADELARQNTDELAAKLAPIFGHDLADQPAISNQQLAAMKSYDAIPRLPELNGLPTLVVSARHDRIAPPAAGQTIAAGIAGAKYVEIADASHGAPIQFASHVNSLLREHFATPFPTQ